MKKKTEVIMDFGSITIPDSWEKLTLNQLDGLMKLQKDAETNGKILSSLDVLSLFTGKDREYLLSLPAEFISSLLARLVFLNTDINPTPKNDITINGETYKVNYTEKLTFGEYVDTNTIMSEQPDNHAAILAILCRKEGEVYDDSFVADKMDERMEMFGNAPAKDCMDIIAFFLTLSVNSGKCSQDYLTAAKSQIDQLLEHTRNSVKRGVGRKRSLLWRMKTLRKLKEYRKCLRQLY